MLGGLPGMGASASAIEATENADRFYTVVKSLNNFDRVEIKGVIDTLLSKNDEENCFVGTYYRAWGQIETVLELKNSRHFQAAAMLARRLFELAVDIRLLEEIPNAWIKMIGFVDDEYLRCCRKMVAFKDAHPSAAIDTTTQKVFIAKNEKRVDALRKSIWPGPRRVRHWSGLRLSERVRQLKSPFDQIYEVEYPTLSWYVHPGMTGVTNLRHETFIYLCSSAFKLVADSYWEVLQTIIRKFKIARANEKIELKMKVAKLLPFTDNDEQVDILTRSIQ